MNWRDIINRYLNACRGDRQAGARAETQTHLMLMSFGSTKLLRSITELREECVGRSRQPLGPLEDYRLVRNAKTLLSLRLIAVKTVNRRSPPGFALSKATAYGGWMMSIALVIAATGNAIHATMANANIAHTDHARTAVAKARAGTGFSLGICAYFVMLLDHAFFAAVKERAIRAADSVGVGVAPAAICRDGIACIKSIATNLKRRHNWAMQLSYEMRRFKMDDLASQ